MNLLEKFDNLEIKNDNRIPEEDRIFCEEQENIYKKLINIYNEFAIKLKEIKILSEEHGNKYGEQGSYFYKMKTAYNSSHGVSGIEETRDKIKNELIDCICSYFGQKYKVTLNTDTIKKKYNLNITYDNIIDEIFIQLNGFSFKEKAVLEIKNKISEILKYKKDISIKKNKLIVQSFFWVDEWAKKYGNYKVGYQSRDNFYSLFKAISCFEQDITENIYEDILYRIDRLKNDDVFCEHVMLCIKVESIKLFKNGKIEIKFISNEYAQQFAREYLNYIESVA